MLKLCVVGEIKNKCFCENYVSFLHHNFTKIITFSLHIPPFLEAAHEREDGRQRRLVGRQSFATDVIDEVSVRIVGGRTGSDDVVVNLRIRLFSKSFFSQIAETYIGGVWS